jgi:uncharacterized protein
MGTGMSNSNAPPMQQCEMIGWGEVLRLSRQVASHIHASGFVPELVIAIARGGYVPARLLCDYLDLFNLTSIRISHYTLATQRTAAARLEIPLAVDIRGKQVLLVDDVSDSGDTLQLAMQHLRSGNPAALKIAVLHHKIVSPLVPDFFGKKIRKWRWLIYPWASSEDISTFIQRMHPRPTTLAQIQAQLAREYRIKVTAAQITTALEVVQQREQA